MRYLICLSILISSFVCKSQTLNYYKVDVNGGWQSITLFIPSGDTTKAVIYYNSSTSKTVQKVNLLKDASKNGVDASLVTFGLEKTKYLLIATNGGKQMIMTDEKQMFTSVFDLDSSLFNPPAQQKKVSDDTVNLLVKAFKFLLL